jgi:peptide/nickel transport system ATP-binding protein
MGLISDRQANITGQVIFKGRDLVQLPKDDMRAIQGNEITMVFQDPLTALNPVHKVGNQIAEVFVAHRDITKANAFGEAVRLLDLVGIPKARDRASQYPHEYSGGMRQRAMIAMALALDPDLLIADEPTTALDVTVQAQILDLIDRLKEEFNAAVVLVTHDLGVVAEHCDNIAVMYAGKVVEFGSARDIYYDSLHPYTWGLLGSVSRLDKTRAERLNPIKGLPPSLIHVPPGCAFHPRCPHVMPMCSTQVPELLNIDGRHASACHLSLEEKKRVFHGVKGARP